MAVIKGGISAHSSIVTGKINSSNNINGSITQPKTIYVDVIYKDDYEQLKNKPFINGVELIGNKTTEDLGDVALTNLEIYNLIQIAKGRA